MSQIDFLYAGIMKKKPMVLLLLIGQRLYIQDEKGFQAKENINPRNNTQNQQQKFRFLWQRWYYEKENSINNDTTQSTN